jgi:hypothetical protein
MIYLFFAAHIVADNPKDKTGKLKYKRSAFVEPIVVCLFAGYTACH